MNSSVLNVIGFWVGVAGLLVTLCGLWYSRYLAQRSEHRKRLVLDVGPSVPLMNIIPESTGIKLSVAYQKDGNTPIQIQSLYLTFVRIGNLGREPIRVGDVAVNDPLILVVNDSSILDISIVETTRTVCQFQMENFVTVVDEGKGDTANQAVARLEFAFLDYQDGVLIRVLTENATPEILLSGTVIGLPQGFDRKNYFESAQNEGCWTMLFLPAFYISGALILPMFKPFFGHLNVGVIGAVAAVVFAAIAFIGSDVSVRRRVHRQFRGEWPEKLSLPYWFHASYKQNQRDIYKD